MAVPASAAEIRAHQERRSARMNAEFVRRRLAGFVLDADDDTNRIKPRVFCPRDLPPRAA